MRTNLIWSVVVFGVALAQTALPGAVEFGGVLPNLTLLMVVYFAIAEGEERAMFSGVLGGLILDVVESVGLGHHVLCYVVVGFAVGRLSRRLVTEHPAVKVGLVFLSALIFGFLYTSIDYLQNPGIDALRLVTADVIPGAFYTTLLTVFVFHFLDRLFKQKISFHGEFS